MLELGASSNVIDGEGKMAWPTAFDNPCTSPANNAIFRECDKHTACALIEMGDVTADRSNIINECFERAILKDKADRLFPILPHEWSSFVCRFATLNENMKIDKFMLEDFATADRSNIINECIDRAISTQR